MHKFENIIDTVHNLHYIQAYKVRAWSFFVAPKDLDTLSQVFSEHKRCQIFYLFIYFSERLGVV